MTDAGHAHDAASAEQWREHAAATLRGAGLRAGGGRAAVVDVLAQEGCLLTAVEIADRLRAAGRPGANLATVYRALDTLRALDLVHRLDAGDGTARFERADPGGEHHHHVVHADGRIEAFHDDDLEHAIDALAERLGIELTGHDIVLHAAGRGDAG